MSSTPRTYRLWTTGEVRRLRGLRAAGLSVAACARALSRTPRSVAWGMRAHGLCRAAPPWRRAPGYLRRWCVRLRRTCGVAEIADRLGVSRQAVYAALGRASRERRELSEGGGR